MGAAGLLVLALGTTPQLSEPDDDLAVASPRAVTAASSDQTPPTFEDVWSKRLQGPIEDPPPQTLASTTIDEPPPAKPPPKLDAKLLGTLVDSEIAHRKAWIELGGESKAVGLGERIVQGGRSFEVVEIDIKCVILKASSGNVELTMESPTSLAGDDQ